MDLLRIIALLVLSIALGSATGRGPAPRAVRPTSTLQATVHCVYLPMVSKAGDGSAAVPRGRSAAAADCGQTLVAVTGAASLLPEHRNPGQFARPTHYVAVLDVSGSMSANFHGQCDEDGRGTTPPARSIPGEPARFWQCAASPFYDTNGDGTGDTQLSPDITGVGSIYYWGRAEERRIYAAKQAVKTLVGQINLPGNPGYTTARPPDDMAIVPFSEQQILTNTFGFSSDRGALLEVVDVAGAYGETYRTFGGSNVGSGLYRAALLLDTAPTSITFGGFTLPYRTHVLLITDSISNQFLDPSHSNLNGGPSDATTYPDGSFCRALGENLSFSVECQTTAVGGTYNGWDRPHTQALKVSQERMQAGDALVSVIAVGSFPSPSLSQGLASSPASFYTTPSLVVNGDGSTQLDSIVEGLPASPVEEFCTPVRATEQTTTIAPANRPEAPGLTFPTVGAVTLRAADGAAYTAPLVVDEATASIGYRFAAVPPGEYQLAATLSYKGEDGVTRAYSLIENAGTPAPAMAVSVGEDDVTLPTLKLRLDGDVCAP